MNGAFVARVLSPAVPQIGLCRTGAARFVAANARRSRKTLEEPAEEAPAPAAEPVSSVASQPTRLRKSRATSVAEEEPSESSETVAKPVRAGRRKGRYGP